MPLDFELDESKQIVLTSGSGELTDGELLSHLRRITEMFQQEVLDSEWGQIADLRNIISVDLVSSQVIQEMALLNPWPDESPRVLIAESDLLFGLSRIYLAWCGLKPERLVLVRSHSEAMEYIQNTRGDSAVET